MSNNQQLPVEVVEEIEQKGERYADKYLNGVVNTREHAHLTEAWITGATEYATKLHHAKELLSAVHRSPDNGDTDDVLNRKIQKFLYGE